MPVKITHGLNDKGVDNIIELGNCKVGFQLKSPFDVTEDDFAAKVKAQMTDSFVHGLDKYYILICSPLKFGKKDYSGRIGHLLNELSYLKTPYHCAYSPREAVKYFDGSPPLTLEEFNLRFQRQSYEPTTLDQLLEVLHSAKSGNRENLLAGIQKVEAAPPTSLRRISNVLKWGMDDKDLAESVAEMKKICQKLACLTAESRQFLSALIDRSDDKLSSSYVLPREIESYLGISPRRVKDEMDILEKYDLADWDEDSEGRKLIRIRSGGDFDSYFPGIKEFCKKTGLPLPKIICDLQFNLLD